jgi:hypothetical protein
LHAERQGEDFEQTDEQYETIREILLKPQSYDGL